MKNIKQIVFHQEDILEYFHDIDYELVAKLRAKLSERYIKDIAIKPKRQVQLIYEEIETLK